MTDQTAAPPVTHEIELVHPIYGQQGASTALCTCGWTSEELPTPGQATIAGWQHINEFAGKPDLGTETAPVDSGIRETKETAT